MLIYAKPKIFDVDLYGLAAIMSICALTWIFFIRPLDRKCQALQLQQQEQHQQKESLQIELARVQNVVQRQRALSTELEHTPNLLENFAGMDQVIRELGDLCLACGMRLDEITPGKKSHNEYYRKTHLAMRAHGSFSQLLVLLDSLAEQMRYTRVATFTVNKTATVLTTDAERQMCQISINLDIFAPNLETTHPAGTSKVVTKEYLK